MFTKELDEALKELVEQWNIAEHRIKLAEQVRGGEVVSSAIYELRYAGRKLVDAFQISRANNLETDAEQRKKVHVCLCDAAEDCVKAKHDAIDAMMNFAVGWFNDLEDELTLEKIKEFFPNYVEQTSRINGIQERIAKSREDRALLRDAIYNTIEKDGYEEILALYAQMRGSKERIAEAIKRQNDRDWWNLFWAVAGGAGTIFFGLLSAILAYFALT